MAERGGDGEDEEPPFTEPVIIPCVYVSGAAVERTRHVTRVVGWTTLPDLGGATRERRIDVRIAFDDDTAQRLGDDLLSQPRRRR